MTEVGCGGLKRRKTKPDRRREKFQPVLRRILSRMQRVGMVSEPQTAKATCGLQLRVLGPPSPQQVAFGA